MNDLFRFMTIRPPQAASGEEKQPIEVTLGEDLGNDLEDASASEHPAEAMSEVASEFVSSESFVPDVAAAHPGLAMMMGKVGVGQALTLQAFTAMIGEVFEQSAADLVNADSFINTKTQIADSLVAATILSCAEHADVLGIVNALRLIDIIERVAVEDPSLSKEGAFQWALDRPVLLPRNLFPLPTATDPNDEKLKEIIDEQRAKREHHEAQQRELRIAHEDLTSALAEVRALGGRDFDAVAAAPADPAPTPVDDDTVGPFSSNIFGRFFSGIANLIRGRTARTSVVRAPAPAEPLVWRLSERGAARLSERTKAILAERDIVLDSLTWPTAIAELQAGVATAASQLQVGSTHTTWLGFGGSLIEAGAFATRENMYLEGLALRAPKPFRVVGVGDLEVVREGIQKYELGEIAHIENVLEGEAKVRRHVRRRRVEEVTTVETEQIEETEQDLQTTERFEQKNESDTTIKEDASRSAGLTVNASYGPYVDVTAEFQTESSRSRTESNRTASKYAREVTSRSVSRLHERVREERVRKSVQEFEELNRHSLKNDKNPDDHVVGVYRWIDKIYKNQVFNYGERLMFEFIVPEPGAYLLWASIDRPAEGTILREPYPPNSDPTQAKDPKDPQFKALSPADIAPENYLGWVTLYQVMEVEPPPHPMHVEPFTLKTSNRRSDDVSYSRVGMEKRVQIPSDYQATEVRGTLILQPVEVHGSTGFDIGGKHELVDLFIGDTHQLSIRPIEYRAEGFRKTYKNGVRPTGSVAVSFQAYHRTHVLLHSEVVCEPTSEAMDRWRQSVYDAIMGAYEEQKAEWENQRSQYEESVRAAKIEEGIAIAGLPPALNRKLEQDELKKGAIRLLTGRGREWEFVFPQLRLSSMIELWDGSPPLLDLAHASTPRTDLHDRLPSDYIQFFEQAFEWSNLYYTLYSYFWARYARWKALQLLDNPDPMHREFLRAGAARVLVPVRPGYESAVLHYLETSKIWQGGEPPTIHSPLYQPLANTVREGHGIVFHKAEGSISVAQGRREVTGTNTAFDLEDDVDREILIEGVPYRIAVVLSPTRLELTEDYHEGDNARAHYTIGAKYVDSPWYARIPTTLVMLEKQHPPPTELPDWSK